MTSGSIGHTLFAYNYSQVSISGGSIGEYLFLYDSSQANISGGSIAGVLYAYGNNQVNISGGSIGIDLCAWGNSQVDIYGGSIGRDLYAYGNSQITIDGKGFNYPYGTITGSGVLTGILANGDPINNYFRTYDYGRITLVPEPATLLLLGFGAVLLRKKH